MHLRSLSLRSLPLRSLPALLAGAAFAAMAIAQPALAQNKDKELSAQCDEQIKKRTDMDQFAKRRFLEQCLADGTKPPKGDPASPDRK